MPATDAEIEALRFHLGYGQLTSVADSYSKSGFSELFFGVVKPFLSDYAATTSTTAVTAAGVVEITPASMTSIVPYARLYVDVGDDLEVVMVRTVTLTTFRATFTRTHPASGYPIQLECGLARMRALLWSVDKAFQKLQASSITQTAGIKQLGNGEIEWFGSAEVLSGTAQHYIALVKELAKLCRIPPAWEASGGGQGNGASHTLEPY